jgi:hypothetical protein
MKAKNPNQSQAAMICALLAKRMAPEKIVQRVKKSLGGNPTVGYVNWLSRPAKSK